MRCALELKFRRDDLRGEATRALIRRHLAGMRANSPPERVHALDVDQLLILGVHFWSVWRAHDIAGCGALKRLDGRRGELKSMRVADAFLGLGVGRALLEHLWQKPSAWGLRAYGWKPAHRQRSNPRWACTRAQASFGVRLSTTT